MQLGCGSECFFGEDGGDAMDGRGADDTCTDGS